MFKPVQHHEPALRPNNLRCEFLQQKSYGRIWADAQGALQDLLQDEMPPSLPRPQKDRFEVFQALGTFYLRYLQIFRGLEAAYDQLIHPQKRRVVRHVLEGVMGRLVELKNELVELEYSEFHYFDDVLQDLKMTPEDLEVPIPRYFVRERIKALKEREKILAYILAKKGDPEPEPVAVHSMTVERAVRLLQVSERARQGRLRAQFMKEIRGEDRKTQRQGINSTLDPHLSATLIQKIDHQLSTPSPTQQRAKQIESSRHQLQEQYEAEYQQALITIKESVRLIDGPDIKETLQDQIRQWFLECRYIILFSYCLKNLTEIKSEPEIDCNHFQFSKMYPDIDPDTAEQTQYSSCLCPPAVTPLSVCAVAEELAAKQQEKEKKKLKKKKDKNAAKEKKKDKKGKAKSKNGKADTTEQEEGWKMSPSNFLSTVAEGSKIYKEVWQARDEGQNFHQHFDPELVREEKRMEVEVEVRVQVDELMRQELQNLKLVVDRDKSNKRKKGKRANKKKKKKAKKSGKKKKKKEKDLTSDRTIESIYEELVLEGILIPSMTMKLWEYSYLGTSLRQADIEPMPSLSDVRQLIALYGVLPLGSQFVHERGPLIRSVLLAGPSGVGKKMLVHALCTETGANLFNLSPANLVGKYPGRSGLQFLMHMVMKVARQLQPSVIWIGDAEKTFYKKVPKLEKELDPKRLKKDLVKVVKSIKAEDRVLLVGTSRRPFDADLKALYLWKELLRVRGVHFSPSLDLSSLAKVTDGYTQGHILQAVRSVLSAQRLHRQTSKPLTALEFIPSLAKQDPIYKEEEEAYKNWYSRTPMGKRRARAGKAFQEATELKKAKKKHEKKAAEAKGKEKKKRK
ncbi:IQ and AAA domain-containing protein 1 [Bagarius yarrelli]|uniref:IQ and AAA domain-containing protein 1 n=1 Tax=Bagarius yarrelli TaxID=175774 RepID=A0A556TT53_BAGYA|nr:IQ and AAA domain-containing protein 1 [Bagarius yarrelli]